MKENTRGPLWLMLGLSLGIAIIFANTSEAACSGSGQTWSCPAGSIPAEVQTAVNNASDGATITFAAGAYSWGTSINLSNSKGVTLICEMQGSCGVTVGGSFIIQLVFSGTNTNLYRVSGFTFQNASSYYTLAFYGYGGTAGSPYKATNVRIDHNTFQNYSANIVAILFGENTSVSVTYGLVDHNTMTGTNNAELAVLIGAEWSSPPEASYQGTANAMYFEDNTLAFTKLGTGGTPCIDSWGGASVVIRHNAMTNCLTASHGVVHWGGPWSYEVYANTFAVDAGGGLFLDGYRLFHHHGSGEFIAFNNTFTAYSGKSTNALAMTHYRTATPAAVGYADPPGRCDGTKVKDGNRSPIGTYYGYPCWRQPGRNGKADLKPMYVWNNRWSDNLARIDMAVENPGGATNPSIGYHIAANRDYYNAVSNAAQTSANSPFNGTAGMGFGTLANRPVTCTTGTEAGGGVGYFATNEGSQGTLYRCSATNTWTTHYTPYTYPHPLQALGGGGTATQPAPTNLRVQ